MSRYARSNPFDSAINTFAAVDNIYRNRRQDKMMEEDRAYNRGLQEEQRGYLREERERAQGIRQGREDIARLQQEMLRKIGPAAKYIDPEARAADRPLLQEGVQRLEQGTLDQPFLLDYVNTLHWDQIQKGSGGKSKRVNQLAPSGKPGILYAGLDVEQEDGSHANRMMTAQRKTLAEGDTELKEIPVQALIKDNQHRSLVIDLFDKYKIDGSDPQAIERALEEADNILIGMGDPDALKRVQFKYQTTRLQAIIDALPADATPQQRQKAIYQEGTRLGIDRQALTDMMTLEKEETRAFKTYKDDRGNTWGYYEDDPENPFKMAGNLKPLTEGQGAAGSGSGKLSGRDKLVAEAAMKRYTDFINKATAIRAGEEVTITEENEFGEPTVKRRATMGDADVYEQMAERERQTLIQMEFIAPDSPKKLIPRDQYIQKAQQFLQENPEARERVMARMEQDYPGSSAELGDLVQAAAEPKPQPKPKQRDPFDVAYDLSKLPFEDMVDALKNVRNAKEVVEHLPLELRVRYNNLSASKKRGAVKLPENLGQTEYVPGKDLYDEKINRLAGPNFKGMSAL